MRFRTLLASTVIGLTTLTAAPTAMAQATQNAAVTQAAARLDAQYAAYNTRTARLVAATITQINKVAATNPIAANTIATRAKATINATATKMIAAAGRTQTATNVKLSRQPDGEARIRSLDTHFSRFDALLEARASQYSQQIDDALAAATGG
jgi:hypothetical protein